MIMTALTPNQMRVAKLALRLRFFQHQIAAYFGCNQGRISEFKNSSMFDRIDAADCLPSGFPHRF